MGENDEATEHAPQKPVECMRRPIVNNSAKGDLVYEPFAGSGSTLIAAETAGRVCPAMEIDPRYCDVIVTRWQRHTGRAATLAEDGRTFDSVKDDRLAA
jgi:DNA modification methylase